MKRGLGGARRTPGLLDQEVLSLEMRQNDKVKEAQAEARGCRGVGGQREASRPRRREAAAGRAGSGGGQSGSR